MGMTRADAVAYLGEEFKEFQDATGLTQDDTTATGYRRVIDDALLKLGVSYALVPTHEVEDAKVQDYRVLLSVYALRRFVRKLGTSPSTDVGEDIKQKRGVLFGQAKELLADAVAEALGLGYTTINPQGVRAMRYGTIATGIYETATGAEL